MNFAPDELCILALFCPRQFYSFIVHYLPFQITGLIAWNHPSQWLSGRGIVLLGTKLQVQIPTIAGVFLMKVTNTKANSNVRDAVLLTADFVQ